jgi:distribution and morphology protein 34
LYEPMSFTFNWPRFSDQFHYDAIQMLNTALNKGNKPPIIADKIEVVELEMGTQPPELEIRDIGELTVDQFRGIFRLTYSGDAYLLLKTKVQANPLNHKHPDIHLMSGSRGMLAAKDPLVVPMHLRLSHFKLNSYVVLVVSKQKGITLVFKTDPLQNVDISSTFDSIAVIQKFIQREIENQLRQMFKEDLPGIIHRLSQQWVKAKVEAPYLHRHPPPPGLPLRRTASTQSTQSAPGLTQTNIRPLSQVPPHLLRQQYLGTLGYEQKAPARTAASMASFSRGKSSHASPRPPKPSSSVSVTPSSPVSPPELEGFDPTYGLRPEGLPTRSIFQGFSQLFQPSKGLADLTEEGSEDTGEYDEDETASFDMLDWDAPLSETIPPSLAKEPQQEFETIPAVGGGTITRPRIFHSQSTIQSPTLKRDHLSRTRESNPYFPDVSTQRGRASFSIGPHDGLESPFTSVASTPYIDGFTPLDSLNSPHRPTTPESQDTHHSPSSGLPTPPSLLPHPEPSVYSKPHHSPIDAYRHRRLSVSSSSIDSASFRPGSPSTSHLLTDSKIVLRPSLNHSIHQLSTLSHSNHTLSPFTRSLEHFTVRSVPPRLATPTGNTHASDRAPTKARRKRTHKLGGKKPDASPVPNEMPPPHTSPIFTPLSSSPVPNSEFDASDMDRYFRSIDELRPTSSNTPPSAQYRNDPSLYGLHQRKGLRTS